MDRLPGQAIRHLDIALVQSKDTIAGYGTFSSDNGTQKVVASGVPTGSKLGLTVMVVGGLDLYKLNLSLGTQTTGSYTAQSPSRTTQSGEAEGTASLAVSMP